MIKLTPDEWVEKTKQCLIEQNKVFGKGKAIKANDYKYIGMAVIVSEFVKKQAAEPKLIFAVGTKIQYTKKEDFDNYKFPSDIIVSYNTVNNMIHFGHGNSISIEDYVKHVESGRFKIVN